MSDTHQVDIIIVGGGMVGLVLAKALADNNFKIAIVESNQLSSSWDPTSVDLRVSAITRASQRILQSLGAWSKINEMRLCPFRDMHVWDATGDGVIHFDSAEIGESCLGHIIENSVIQTALLQVCQSHNNISWFPSTLPEAIVNENQQTTLLTNSGTRIAAKLVVGADGGKSWVRDSSGIAIDSTDYKQTAIVATVKTQLDHKETAWQRFLPSGPLAFLPLSDGHCSIVWSTTPEYAEDLTAMDDALFCEALTSNFDNKLGEITETSKRGKFPLRSQHAKHYIQNRLALVGDAAHTIHPLAGQGVNLGFADAASLAEILTTAKQNKRDIGSVETLRRYERWRKGENHTMLTAMTGFKSLFGNNNPLLTSIRNLGLNMTDNVSPIKNLIIRHAMGLTGDLPKLARGRSTY